MRHRFACDVFVAVIMVLSAAPSHGQVQTVYDSATDPRIVAVLDAHKPFEVAGRRLIISRGADARALSNTGVTALQWAAYDLTKIRLLLSAEMGLTGMADDGAAAASR
jgi:hypothetical protein